jgi:hypothetical protein
VNTPTEDLLGSYSLYLLDQNILQEISNHLFDTDLFQCSQRKHNYYTELLSRPVQAPANAVAPAVQPRRYGSPWVPRTALMGAGALGHYLVTQRHYSPWLVIPAVAVPTALLIHLTQ